MKKQFLTLSILFTTYFASAQVGVGTTTPHASAVLDVTSTTQGLLPPRMTQAQRDAIASPASGLLIWCTNCGSAGEFQGYNGTTWTNLTGGTASGATISTITCGSATNSGTLTSGTAASGVSSAIPYTGGNAGTHSGQTVTSTSVTGLTATLSAGTFASGSGSLTYTITGTPASSGTASFAISIGGQTCTLTRTVTSSFTCGTSTVTFTYNGGSVTYGTVVGANSKCWLDRNLGATQVATSSTDANSYGHYFQWGRGADGHQVSTSGTTSTQSATDSPGHANFIVDAGDWRSTQNDNLWQGVSGTNNPCPSGWRLPTQTEFDTEIASWSPNSYVGAFASTLKMPLANMRGTSGTFYTADSYSRIWTSTVSGVSAVRIGFDNSGSAVSSTATARTMGGTVRCIKD